MSDYQIDIVVNPTAAVSGGNAASDALDKITRSGKDAQSTTDGLSKSFTELGRAVDPAATATANMATAQKALTDAQEAGVAAGEASAKLLQEETAALAASAAAFEEKLAKLEQETNFMRLSAEEREVQTRLLSLENDLRRQGVEVTSQQTAALLEQLRMQQAINAQQEASAALGAERSLGSIAGGAGSELLGAAIGGAIGIGVISSLADEYTSFQNKVRSATSSEAEFTDVSQKLQQVANDTRTSLDDVGQQYLRIHDATADLGLTTDQTTQFVKELNEATIIQGASAGEANRAIMDLVHGLSQGAVNTRELKQIMGQVPEIADVLAEHFGSTRGQLLELAKQGKITGEEVVKAFSEADAELSAKFGKTVPTLAQDFTVLKNNLAVTIGEFLSSSGVLTLAAEGVKAISGALQGLAEGAKIAIEEFHDFTGMLSAAGGIVSDLTGNVVTLSGAVHDLAKSFGSLSFTGSLGGDSFDQAEALIKERSKDWQGFAAIASAMQGGGAAVPNIAGIQGASLSNSIDPNKIGQGYAALFGEVTDGANRAGAEMKDLTGHITGYTAAQRKWNSETERLPEQLDQIAAKASPLEAAYEKMIKAEELVAKAREHHISVNERVLEGLNELEAKYTELAVKQAGTDVAGSAVNAFSPLLQGLGFNKAPDPLMAIDWNGGAEIDKWKKLTEQGNSNLLDPFANQSKIASGADALRSELEKLASPAGVLKNAFNSMNNALIQFLETGKVNWSSFVSSIETDIEKLLVHQGEMALLGLFVGGAPTADIGALGGMAGLPSGFWGVTDGHDSGASWTVGGSGTADSIPQLFMTSPGERVTVESRAQVAASNAGGGGGHGGVSVIMDARRAVAEGMRSRTGYRSLVNVFEYNPSSFAKATR